MINKAGQTGQIVTKGETVLRQTKTQQRQTESVPHLGRIARFLRTEEGGVSVEFALWMPLLVSIILLIADASFAMMRQSSLLAVSRETARIVARHGLNIDEAVIYAESKARNSTDAPVVSVEIDSDSTNVTVRIVTSMHDLAPFGILEKLFQERVLISTVHALEPI
ncbi:pilus assembly protein [Tabrizicola sp. WMC-M-20]|nr:pilus assembly protein [Tabrizicola sp. WMC-M-20]